MEPYIGILGGYGTPSPTLSAATHQVVRGVMDEARQARCPYFIEPHTHFNPDLFRSGNCAGLIGFFWGRHTEELDPASASAPACVNISNSAGPLEGYANVLSDDPAVGALAARHLLRLGHADFLAVGQANRVYSRERLEGFAREVERAGGNVRRVEVPGGTRLEQWSPSAYKGQMWDLLRDEFARLPASCGVFAVSDWIAWPILRLLEEKSPERLHTTAVLGVDNLGEAVFDPRQTSGLSSIVPGFHACGQTALRVLLDHINDPEALARIHERLPPDRVVEGVSTAGPACGDPLVAKVVRAMWLAVREGMPVDLSDLAQRNGMSARTLEYKFQEVLGRSARDHLVHLRLDYAKQLLADPRRSVSEVAMKCGYADPPAFSNAFKRGTGLSPRDWRKQRQR